jgi:DHA1 family bicyclomycin/chloramphenicol resistance-like MFS transporter
LPQPEAPAQELARAAKVPLGKVLLLGTLTALGPLSIDMYLPGLPAMAKSLATTPAAAQQTVAIFFIGLSVGQLVYGPLSDRYGRRWPILIGLLLYVAGSLGCALAPSINVLFAFRVLQALGACSGMVLVRAVVRDTFHTSEMLHINSLLMLVIGISPIFAPLVGGWMLLIGGWRTIFYVQLLAGVIVGLAVLFRLPESRSAETAARARAENPVKSYLSLLRSRLLLAYLLAGAFSGAALFTYVASSPDVLIGQFHVAPQLFGWVFGVNGFGIIAVSQVNARLARRWPADTILRRANLVTIGSAAVLLIAAVTGFGGLWGVLVPLFCVISSLGFSSGNASNEAMRVDPHRAGATAALSGAASFGAGSICAALAGAFRDGTATPMAVVIIVSLIVAAVSLRVLAPIRRG